MTYSSRGRADLLRALGHDQPALTGVWLPLQSADAQQHRGRAPPSRLHTS